mgnify:CR=1 FL=1
MKDNEITLKLTISEVQMILDFLEIFELLPKPKRSDFVKKHIKLKHKIKNV